MTKLENTAIVPGAGMPRKSAAGFRPSPSPSVTGRPQQRRLIPPRAGFAGHARSRRSRARQGTYKSREPGAARGSKQPRGRASMFATFGGECSCWSLSQDDRLCRCNA
jgi:hypothetical protein